MQFVAVKLVTYSTEGVFIYFDTGTKSNKRLVKRQSTEDVARQCSRRRSSSLKRANGVKPDTEVKTCRFI